MLTQIIMDLIFKKMGSMFKYTYIEMNRRKHEQLIILWPYHHNVEMYVVHLIVVK